MATPTWNSFGGVREEANARLFKKQKAHLALLWNLIRQLSLGKTLISFLENRYYFIQKRSKFLLGCGAW
ncbi:hypothetical protein [Erythrobacter westpacificensis]|uniref:hypothetical protein n=1 Tax=Erythrobacter westpacificensis TaxID=1055231 RepID=UPI0031F843E4